MMQVNSIITINTAAVNQLTALAKQALAMTAESMHTEVQNAQVVPRDKGTLQGEAMFVDKSKVDMGKVSIVHSEPYARRWYFNPEVVAVGEYTIKNGKRAGKTVRAYTAHKANFSLAKNPYAKDHWFEDWQEGGQYENFCPQTFRRMYRLLLRGGAP